MNILITAAATVQAYRVLRLVETNNNVVFADSADLPAFMLKNRKFIKIAPGNSPSFSHELLTICLDMQIDKVFPLRKDEIRPLSESRTLFSEYGIRVIVPSLEVIEKMEMKSGPGEIIVKESDDCGIFLTGAGGTDGNPAIFTVD